ncbi:DUF58 domain-containing protein [Candidatus Pacearchaeota archaeon]|nr:DUF58 domain-containing protein [Candidatus Pacearchaeota archaeon]
MKTLKVDFATKISQFEKVIKEFQLRRILYKSLFRAKGLEFEEYRHFEKDEDASSIDWKASLRAGEMLARKYVEERDMDIYFVVDASKSMFFGSKEKLKAEYAAEIVAVLSNLTLDSNDNPGLIMFQENLVKKISPRKGKKQFNLIMRFLCDGENYGGNFDINNAIKYLLKSISSKFSVVILISDFIHVKKEFKFDLNLLSKRFETIAIMVRDSLDEELPKTSQQILIEDPHSGKQMVVNPSLIAENYKKNVKKQKEAITRIFREKGIDLLELSTGKEFIIPLVSFLRARAGTFAGGGK